MLTLFRGIVAGNHCSTASGRRSTGCLLMRAGCGLEHVARRVTDKYLTRRGIGLLGHIVCHGHYMPVFQCRLVWRYVTDVMFQRASTRPTYFLAPMPTTSEMRPVKGASVFVDLNAQMVMNLRLATSTCDPAIND